MSITKSLKRTKCQYFHDSLTRIPIRQEQCRANVSLALHTSVLVPCSGKMSECVSECLYIPIKNREPLYVYVRDY